MSLSQVLPAAVLGALSLVSVPTVVFDTTEALLEVPAIATVVPDAVEGWLEEAIRVHEQSSTSTSSKSTSSKQGGGSAVSSKDTSSSARQAEATSARSDELALPSISDRMRSVDGATKTPDAASESRPAGVVKPVREASAASSSEPFGHWVKEQTHAGVRGRELADRIHEAKAARK